jgi:hypothetical protein
MLTNSVRVIRRAILACLLAAAASLGVASISSLGSAHGNSYFALAADQRGDPSPARLQTAPAAVIAFNEGASDEVRAIIAPEVAEARLALAGSPLSDVSAQSPSAPQVAYRVGIGGVSCTHTTIQAAINDAHDGDTVRVVGSQIFAESLNITRTVTIEGGYDLDCRALVAGSASRVNSPGNSTVDVYGGGIAQLGNLTITGGTGPGAGIHVYNASSQATLSNTVVTGNNGTQGGGIYVDFGCQVTLTGGSLVSNNSASQGGGAYVLGRLGVLDTTSGIVENTAAVDGGGVYVMSGGALYLNGADMGDNAATGAAARGGAIFVNAGQVTLSNSRLISNTAASTGGGIHLVGASMLTVTNGSELSHNSATSGAGGAIAATGAPTITIRDSTLQDNSAGTDGGAIYLDAGALAITGWWDLRYNHAGGSGGAIAVSGAGNADMDVTGGGQPSFLAVNTAGANGGAVYLGNNDTLALHAVSGWPLRLNSNEAQNGGAVYADGGGLLEVFGYVQATSNRAYGNGGVFYLTGGSRLWLDDFSTTRPQVMVNHAQNGGAIFASGSPRVDCDGTDFGYVSDGNEALTGNGGAIYLIDSSMTSDNCVFRHNSAAINGGAIAAFASRFALDANYPSPITLELAGATDRLSPAGISPQTTACQPASGQCSSLHDNTAGTVMTTTGSGGAIYSHDSLFSVNQTYLHRNTAAFGGAIYQDGAAALGFIDNTLVYSNTTTQGIGAGIRVAAGALTITHGTLANNIGGAGLSRISNSSYLYNTITWGNSTISGTPLAVASCNIDQGGAPDGLASNPLFVSAGAGEDYRVLYNSPAVDACASGLPVDITNRVRPFGGALYDMGAHEFPVRQVFLPMVARQ